MALLLANGLVLDGTGKAAVPADVLIDGSRIQAVEPCLNVADAERVDCTNLIVAPGFIDAHSHSQT